MGVTIPCGPSPWAHPNAPVASTTTISALRSLTMPKSFPLRLGSDEISNSRQSTGHRPVPSAWDGPSSRPPTDPPAPCNPDAQLVSTINFKTARPLPIDKPKSPTDRQARRLDLYFRRASIASSTWRRNSDQSSGGNSASWSRWPRWNAAIRVVDQLAGGPGGRGAGVLASPGGPA